MVHVVEAGVLLGKSESVWEADTGHNGATAIALVGRLGDA